MLASQSPNLTQLVLPIARHAPATPPWFRARRHSGWLAALVVATLFSAMFTLPAQALDLVAFTGITGPLVSALSQMAALSPGVKALVAFIGFVVALISLTALRNFGPVLFFLGMAIFGAVGLTIAGAILGAVI